MLSMVLKPTSQIKVGERIIFKGDFGYEIATVSEVTPERIHFENGAAYTILNPKTDTLVEWRP